MAFDLGDPCPFGPALDPAHERLGKVECSNFCALYDRSHKVFQTRGFIVIDPQKEFSSARAAGFKKFLIGSVGVCTVAQTGIV